MVESLVSRVTGWIKLRNLPLHLWRLNIFKAIGDSLWGFIEYEESNSLLIECMELKMKIRNNYCGFIPAEVRIVDGDDQFKIQIVTYQDGNLLIDRVVEIHCSFSPEAAHAFHRGPNDPLFCPVDIWRIENGIEYPLVNTQEILNKLHDAERQLDNSKGKFEISRQKAKIYAKKLGRPICMNSQSNLRKESKPI